MFRSHNPNEPTLSDTINHFHDMRHTIVSTISAPAVVTNNTFLVVFALEKYTIIIQTRKWFRHRYKYRVFEQQEAVQTSRGSGSEFVINNVVEIKGVQEVRVSRHCIPEQWVFNA